MKNYLLTKLHFAHVKKLSHSSSQGINLTLLKPDGPLPRWQNLFTGAHPELAHIRSSFNIILSTQLFNFNPKTTSSTSYLLILMEFTSEPIVATLFSYHMTIY
jgi:hypothetical protein